MREKLKFDIKNLSDNAIELFFYGDIVGSELDAWSYDDQYPSAVRDFLADNKGKEVHVRINSGGGSCFSGICIGEMLKNHNGKTVAHVDGLCASIATYIACCCDEIRIHKNSYFMCHNAWTMAVGNKNDLRETIALLEKMDNSIAEVYMKHTNKSIEEIEEMMNAETWMCGAEILDTFNFIMEEEEEEKVAYAKVDFDNYKNIPKSLLAQLQDEEVCEKCGKNPCECETETETEEQVEDKVEEEKVEETQEEIITEEEQQEEEIVDEEEKKDNKIGELKIEEEDEDDDVIKIKFVNQQQEDEVVEDSCKKKPDDKCDDDEEKKCEVEEDDKQEEQQEEQIEKEETQEEEIVEPNKKDDDKEEDEDVEDKCKKEKEKAQAQAKKELEFLKAKMFLDNFK